MSSRVKIRSVGFILVAVGNLWRILCQERRDSTYPLERSLWLLGRARSRREENSEDAVADVLARGGKGRVAAMQMVL